MTIDYDPHVWDDDARKAASTMALVTQEDHDQDALVGLVTDCVKERPVAYVVALLSAVLQGRVWDENTSATYQQLALQYQQAEDYSRSQGQWRK